MAKKKGNVYGAVVLYEKTHKGTSIGRRPNTSSMNKNKGKASLRKRMYEKAMKGNDKLLIWLSKNYLKMVDKVHTTSTTEPLPLIIEAKAEEVKYLNGKEKR